MIYYVQFQDGLDCKISVSQSSLKRVMVAHGDLRMEGTLDMLFLSDWQAFPHCQLMIHQEVRMDLCCKVFPLPMAMPNREKSHSSRSTGKTHLESPISLRILLNWRGNQSLAAICKTSSQRECFKKQNIWSSIKSDHNSQQMHQVASTKSSISRPFTISPLHPFQAFEIRRETQQSTRRFRNVSPLEIFTGSFLSSWYQKRFSVHFLGKRGLKKKVMPLISRKNFVDWIRIKT